MFASITLLAAALQGVVPWAATTITATPPVPAAVATTPATSTPVSAIRLARADSLVFAGDVTAAQSLYRSLAYHDNSTAHYAKQPLWDLAMADRLADQPFRMVTTLDRLASAARRYGDPEMELVASFEAARYYAAMGQPVVARDRLARVRALLQSPVLPAAIRADYTARMKTVDCGLPTANCRR